MKRLFIVFFLLICISLSLFAYDGKVGVYPANSEIEKYLTDYFGIKPVRVAVSFSMETVLSEDFRLLEYICKVSGADFLIFPQKSDLSGLNYYTIHVYDRTQDKMELIYEHISQDADSYTVMAAQALAPYFTDNEIDFEPEVEAKIPLEKKYGYNLYVSSKPESEVWMNGISLGKTPLTIDEYEIPSVLRFTGEGFADSYQYIDKQTNTLSVNLSEIQKADKNNYKEAKNTFYKAFGINLLSIGLKAAVPSFIKKNSPAYKWVDYTSDAVIATFAVNTIICLVRYFRSAQQVSP